MAEETTRIPISDIILDEAIYPRDRIDQKRVGIFAENIRDGFTFDPIEVEPAPDKTRQIPPPRWRSQMERLQGNRGNRAGSHNKEPGWVRSPALCGQKGHRPPAADRRRDKKNRETGISEQSRPDLSRDREGQRPFPAGSRLLHRRSSCSNPDGTGTQDISYEPARHPAGQDCKKIRRNSGIDT